MRAFDAIHKSLASDTTQSHRALSGNFADTVWVDVLAQAEIDEDLHQQLQRARAKAESMQVLEKHRVYKAFVKAAAESLYDAGASQEIEFDEIFSENTLAAIASNIALQS